MVKYSTTIFLFAVAVFWPSVSARSVHGHYEEPHHGISVENDADIEEFIQWGFKAAVEVADNSRELKALRNILHEVKHKYWSSLDELAEYLQTTFENFDKETGDENSQRKRDVDSDEASEELTNDQYQFGKSVVLHLMIQVAPPAHRAALEQEFQKILEKEYDSVDDFSKEAERVFKEVTGDDIDDYEDKFNAALQSLLA